MTLLSSVTLGGVGEQHLGGRGLIEIHDLLQLHLLGFAGMITDFVGIILIT